MRYRRPLFALPIWFLILALPFLIIALFIYGLFIVVKLAVYAIGISVVAVRSFRQHRREDREIAVRP